MLCKEKGYLAKLPRVLPGVENIQKMYVGRKHAVFLDTEGQLFAVGRNNEGQCGLPPYYPNVYPPVRIESDIGTGWDLVSVGKRHTNARRQALYTGNGRKVIDESIYSWGDDSDVQLGCGDTRGGGYEQLYAQPMDTLSMYKSGRNEEKRNESKMPHNVDINDYGEVVGPAHGGKNKSIKPTATVIEYSAHEPHLTWTPHLIQPFHLEPERRAHKLEYPATDHIISGDKFSLFRVRDSPDGWPETTHKLFCVGDNRVGQCGRTFQQSHQVPARTVKLPRRVHVHDVQCGNNHCFAYIQRWTEGREKEVWAWGDNRVKQISAKKPTKVCPPYRVDPSIRKAVEEGGLMLGDVAGIYCGHTASCIVYDPPGEKPIKENQESLEDDDNE